jgi:YfiH family protein
MKGLPLNKGFCEAVTAWFSLGCDFALSQDGRFQNNQYAYLLEQFAGDVPSLVTIRQVHGCQIAVIDRKEMPIENVDVADGAITDQPHVALTIRTADCLPVFLYDPLRPAIGLIHAGWKGTHQGITAQAVQTMKARWGTLPESLHAAFGPAIRTCCYKVGKEMRSLFPGAVEERGAEDYLDLAYVNRQQLMDAGVQAVNIDDCELCTCCDSRFYSYRRDGQRAGRHLSLMILNLQSAEKKV